MFDPRRRKGKHKQEERLFGTMTQQLRELAQWLLEAKVSAVAMEATEVYWVPVWNVLESAGLQLVLINPEHYRAVRGRKTDLKDGERIAELLQDGRLEGSYVPPPELRVLQDLTRYRIKLVEHQSSIACSIQKLLERCNIKLGSVASNVLGVSGTAMLHALAQGESNPERLADMAKMEGGTSFGQLRLSIVAMSLNLREGVFGTDRWWTTPNLSVAERKSGSLTPRPVANFMLISRMLQASDAFAVPRFTSRNAVVHGRRPKPR